MAAPTGGSRPRLPPLGEEERSDDTTQDVVALSVPALNLDGDGSSETPRPNNQS